MTAIMLKPPQPLAVPREARALFLAGSIEMGAATDWQMQLSTRLRDLDRLVILNPRREAWDASWRQSIENRQFREQVEWELDGMAVAEVIAMYLAPETRAPISLLELGLHAGSGKLVVCCPEGFWRKGNVEIVCARYRIEMAPTLDALAQAVRMRLEAP